MDKTGQHGEKPAITKRRHPASCPAPRRQQAERSYAADHGIIGIRGNIVDPPGVEWEAEIDPDRVMNP